MRFPLLLALVAVPLVASSLHAGVIVVDPGGGGDFTSLPPAIAAAVEGDTVLISPSAPCVECLGGAFVSGKSLTIVFDTAAGSSAAYPLEGLHVTNLAAGQTVVLRGLHVANTIFVDFNDGAVWIEDCTATGHQGSGDVGLGGCFTPDDQGSGWPGIYAWNCDDITVVDCTLQGGPGGDALFIEAFPSLSRMATDGGSGLFAAGAAVAVYGSFLTAGKGGSGQLCFEFAHGGPGLDAGHSFQAPRVLLSGCTVLGGQPGTGPQANAPGPGVRGDATSTFEIVDSSVTAWPGGVDFATAPGAVVHYPGAARRFTLPAPLREGETGTLTIEGELGDFVGFLFSFQGGLTRLPSKSGWFLLGGPFLAGPFPLGTITDPSGEWLVPIRAPNLPAAFEAQTFLLQAYFQYTGGATLGSGTAFTLVDSAF